jgi:hypothetical protein
MIVSIIMPLLLHFLDPPRPAEAKRANAAPSHPPPAREAEHLTAWQYS